MITKDRLINFIKHLEYARVQMGVKITNKDTISDGIVFIDGSLLCANYTIVNSYEDTEFDGYYYFSDCKDDKDSMAYIAYLLSDIIDMSVDGVSSFYNIKTDDVDILLNKINKNNVDF